MTSSWLLLGYKFLVLARFANIFFLNGYRPLDDYGTLVGDFMKSTTTTRTSIHQNTATSTSITRTHALPMLSGEISSLLLNLLRLRCGARTSWSWIFTPYFVVRILSTSASLTIDYFLFRIAKRWRIKPNLVLFLYASSSIPLTFFTFISRSCLVETIVFTLFLYFIIRSAPFEVANDSGGQQKRSNGAADNSIASDHNHHVNCGYSKCSGNSNYDEQSITNAFDKDALTLGILFAIGVSNRLNFAIFSLAPLVQWLLSTSSSSTFYCRNWFLNICGKMCHFLFGFIVCITVIAIIDSITTGKVEIDKFPAAAGQLDAEVILHLLSNNLTTSIAVWNSLQAELSLSNMVGRSINPWYTHVFINIPLIYGVFGICVMLYFLQCLRLEILSRIHLVNARYWFLLSSFVVPAISLSIYPKKTAEDLFPLLIPMTLVVVIRISQYDARLRTRLILAWCSWNAFALFYHGYLYNGSLIKSISDLERIRRTASSPAATSYAYHFYATDEPPSISWFSSLPEIIIPDESSSTTNRSSSSSPAVFYYRKKDKAKFYRRLTNARAKYGENYVLSPATVSLCDLRGKRGLSEVMNLRLVNKYYVHYSPEAPPNLWRIFGCGGSDDDDSVWNNNQQGGQGCHRDYHVPCMDNKWHQIYESLALNVYRVQQ